MSVIFIRNQYKKRAQPQHQTHFQGLRTNLDLEYPKNKLRLHRNNKL